MTKIAKSGQVCCSSENSMHTPAGHYDNFKGTSVSEGFPLATPASQMEPYIFPHIHEFKEISYAVQQMATPSLLVWIQVGVVPHQLA